MDNKQTPKNSRSNKNTSASPSNINTNKMSSIKNLQVPQETDSIYSAPINNPINKPHKKRKRPM